MLSILRTSYLFLLGAFFFLFGAQALCQEKETMGWVEKISISPEGFFIHAKLDTGADYSSLSAQGQEKFEKDGKEWIRFHVKNRYGKMKMLEREIVRKARIKRHGGGAHERYVVQLGICLGHKYMEEEFNLANRENFNYQALIGRNFLAGNTIVDPAVTYTVTPACTRSVTKDKN